MPTQAPFPKKKKKNRDKELLKWKDLKERLENLRHQDDVKIPSPWKEDDYNEFNELLSELVARDGDSVNLYRPLKDAKPFHECLAHEQGLSGSNQAGKTNAASTEVAYAATGTHPIPGKYPKDSCRIACIGNDARHTSLMYEYLFEKAPYKRFFHPVLLEWFVVKPDDLEHLRYKELWHDAEPIISPRMVKKVTWVKKGDSEPRMVRLHNGTTIRFYSGLVRKMPQGRKFHLVWIDEEIDNAKAWIDELRARIQSFNGRIIWSATPQNATEQFFDFMHRAKNPDNALLPLSKQTAFFVMQSADNPYISAEGRDAFHHKLLDDDEQMQIRYFGNSARSYMLVYPEWSSKNVIPSIKLRWEDTRYIIIDPGVDTAAVWFVAAPQLDDPRHAQHDEFEAVYRVHPGCLVVYDELLIKRASSQLVAEAIDAKMKTHPIGPLWDLTIDQKGGRSIRSKEQAAHESIEDLYMNKILAVGIKPVKPGWKYGSSDIKAGIDQTKTMILPQQDTPWIRLFITKNCVKTNHQFEGYKKKRDHKGNFVGYEEGYDLLDCGRYTTTRVGMAWQPPPESARLMQMTRSDYRQIMNDLKSGRGFF